MPAYVVTTFNSTGLAGRVSFASALVSGAAFVSVLVADGAFDSGAFVSPEPEPEPQPAANEQTITIDNNNAIPFLYLESSSLFKTSVCVCEFIIAHLA